MNKSRIKWLGTGIAFVSLIHLISLEASAAKRIGIFTFTEEALYSEAQKGIIDQLKKDGLGEPAVTFTIKNAYGSKAQTAEIVRQFAAARLDLIFTIGTSATLPITREIKDVPVVFSVVFDPVETGIARDWKSSGNNTTGASSRVPMSKIIETLRAFKQIHKLAVLYTPGEKNSEAQLKDLQRLPPNERVTIVPIILTNKEEASLTLLKVVQTVDAIYLTGSSIIGASVPIIVDGANKANVATITHLDDLVEKGALVGVCPNSYQIGRLAGTKAVKILKGAKPSSIPIEAAKTLDIILNIKTAKAGKFQIPPAFMKTVTKTIE